VTTREHPRLLLVGSGSEAFRAYSLGSIAERASVVLLTSEPPTWEQPYLRDSEVVDFGDADGVLDAARRLRPDGVLTYDERYVELTARLAVELGLPYASPEATRTCKDKLQLRRVLREHGLSPVRFGVAYDYDGASRLAGEIGYPVVVKPRALAGSAGVVRVDDADALQDAFGEADDAHIGTIRSGYGGVLIEECLEGPEYSVDCLTVGGVTTPVVVAEKVVDLPPYYEEVRHFVPPIPRPGLAEALELVAQVHRAAGLDHVATHSEFRLTPAGPRIIEVNVRLGGDLIPYLGLLASGVDLPAAAADIALGRTPDLAPRRDVAAAVHFFYPDDDLEVERVALARPADAFPGLDRFIALVGRGDTLLLPPRGFISRLALAVVTGADRAQCEARLAGVVDGFVCEGRPVTAIQGAAS
jgi:biotin carboxylase